MKTKILLTTTLLLAGMVASAQFYADIHGGFIRGANGTVFGSYQTFNSTGQIQTYGNEYGTFGQGIVLGIRGGYMANENVGVDLAIDMFNGSAQRTSEGSGASDFEWLEEAQGRQLRIVPSVLVRSNRDSRLNWYSRLGLLMALNGSTTYEGTERYLADDWDWEDEYEDEFGIGCDMAFGGSVDVTDRIGINLEFYGTALTTKTKSYKAIRDNFNGMDQLATTDTYFKEVIFVDELTSSSNNFGMNTNASLSSAREELAFSNHWNGAGIRVAVVIMLGNNMAR